MGEESKLEKWARDEIFEAGGWMLKWASPGQKGVPDNIIFWPGNVIHLAEFKAPDGDTEYMQTHVIKALREFGATVLEPRNKDFLQTYIDQYHK